MNIENKIIVKGDFKIEDSFDTAKFPTQMFLLNYQARVFNYANHIELNLHKNKVEFGELHAKKEDDGFLIEHAIEYDCEREFNDRIEDFVTAVCLVEKIAQIKGRKTVEIEPIIMPDQEMIASMGYVDYGINQYKKIGKNIIYPDGIFRLV